MEDLSKRGSEIRRAAVEKDETDTELAVQVAIDEGATRITLAGALGGARFDHAMANVLLLAGFEDVPITLVDGPSICWIVRGPGSSAIDGQVGDLVSLLPLTGDAQRHTYKGVVLRIEGGDALFWEAAWSEQCADRGTCRGICGEWDVACDIYKCGGA